MEANSSTSGDHDRSRMEVLDSSRGASHPSRAHSERGVKLFGVRLTHEHNSMNMMMNMMRKTVSMGNLCSYNTASLASPNAAIHPSTPERSESGEGLGPADPHGYVSDGLVQNSRCIRERKKGVPWTEDEHRMFLVGLQKLGKGDWRGIARNFVPSRTPTQVASHAQKYFLRQNNLNKRKRRSSLFDMTSSNPVSTISTPDHAGSLAVELNLGSPPTSVSADLCLGIRPDEAMHQEQQSSVGRWWCHTFSSGMQAPTISENNKLLPLALNFSSESSLRESHVPKPSTGIASLTLTSALSSSSSSSSLSSLGRIDENSEVPASLTLSIGPPPLSEPPTELSLRLEQTKSARHAAIGDNGNTLIANAIRVV